MASRVAGRRGFTLIETVVVMGLLGLVVSFLLSAVQSVRGNAAKLKCGNNLKQIGTGIHLFEQCHGTLPPYRPGRSVAEKRLSWMVSLTPFLEQDGLWREAVAACAIEPRVERFPPHNGYRTPLKALVCASDVRLSVPLNTPKGDEAAFASYLGVSGSLQMPEPGKLSFQPAPGAFPGYASKLASFTDGQSSTIMVGERPPPQSLQAGRWYTGYLIREPFGGPDIQMSIPQPIEFIGDLQCRSASSKFGPGRLDNPCDRMHFWSLHGGGANFAFADGSVRFLGYESAPIMPMLATRAGGEAVSLP